MGDSRAAAQDMEQRSAEVAGFEEPQRSAGRFPGHNAMTQVALQRKLAARRSGHSVNMKAELKKWLLARPVVQAKMNATHAAQGGSGDGDYDVELCKRPADI